MSAMFLDLDSAMIVFICYRREDSQMIVDRIDGQARVQVCDRGSGIAPPDRERVFEKFTRAGVGLTRGTGLGLYLAREIVQAHGGRIWVADTEGPGTTVVFTIPLRTDARG